MKPDDLLTLWIGALVVFVALFSLAGLATERTRSFLIQAATAFGLATIVVFVAWVVVVALDR